MKIGIIDSGAGGLTILNAIHQKQPYLNLIYLADDEFAPYGSKTIVQLQERLIKIGQFFENEDVSAIVVACNTATVVAIDALRASTSLPVIGVEPAVKPAFRMSKQCRVAVLATPVTAQSTRLNQLIDLWKADNYVSVMSSDTLAFDIDAWPESTDRINQTILQLSQNLKIEKIDTLVLACTHYPLVKSLFKTHLGDNVAIIEPSEGVTSQLIQRLENAYPNKMKDLLNKQRRGNINLCSSLSLVNMPRLISWMDKPESITDKRLVNV